MQVGASHGNYQTRHTGYTKSKSEVNETAKKEDVKNAEEAVSEKKTDETSEKRTDSFTRSDKAAVSVDYRSKTALGIKNEGMKDVVAQMLGKQAQHAGGKSVDAKIENILKSYGVDPIKSDGSEDFWGAEKTANRILDFAKSLVGDDKEAFGKVKAAFEKGFGECEKIWGGKLPSVCYDTLDKVRKGFDDWEKEKFSGETKTE